MYIGWFFYSKKRMMMMMIGVGPRRSCKGLFKKLDVLSVPCLYILPLMMFVVISLENFQPTSFTTLYKYKAQKSSAYACSKSFMCSIRGYLLYVHGSSIYINSDCTVLCWIVYFCVVYFVTSVISCMCVHCLVLILTCFIFSCLLTNIGSVTCVRRF
jgi:hypothetical protein